MNQARYQRVLDQITDCPETWDQTNWHNECGTVHCFAGWAQIMSGNVMDWGSAKSDAREWLGLTHLQADYVFHGARSLKELQHFLQEPRVALSP